MKRDWAVFDGEEGRDEKESCGIEERREKHNQHLDISPKSGFCEQRSHQNGWEMSNKEGSDNDSPLTNSHDRPIHTGSYSSGRMTSELRQMAHDLKMRALEVAKHPSDMRRAYSPVGYGLKGDSFYITNERYLRTIFDDVKHLSLLSSSSGSRGSSSGGSPSRSSSASPAGTPVDSPIMERKPSSLRVVSRTTSRLPSARDLFKTNSDESPITITQAISPAFNSPATGNSPVGNSPIPPVLVTPTAGLEVEIAPPVEERPRSRSNTLTKDEPQEVFYVSNPAPDRVRSPYLDFDSMEESNSLRNLRRTSSDSAPSPILSESGRMIERMRRNTDGMSLDHFPSSLTLLSPFLKRRLIRCL